MSDITPIPDTKNDAEVAAVVEETNSAEPALTSASDTNEQVVPENDETVEEQEEEEEEVAGEDEADGEPAQPFLDQALEGLDQMDAEQMQSLLSNMVKNTKPENVQAQKDVHDAEIESMQKLMMDAQQEGLLNEDDVEAAEGDDGEQMQSTADGSILLKSKAGDHNPILDDLRKKQRSGLLTAQEEEMLGRAIAYQKKMTGAIGTEELPDDDNDDDDDDDDREEG